MIAERIHDLIESYIAERGGAEYPNSLVVGHQAYDDLGIELGAPRRLRKYRGLFVVMVPIVSPSLVAVVGQPDEERVRMFLPRAGVPVMDGPEP